MDLWAGSAQFFEQCVQEKDSCLDASGQIKAEHVQVTAVPFVRAVDELCTLVRNINLTSLSVPLRSARLDAVDASLFRFVQQLSRPDSNPDALHREVQQWFDNTAPFWLDRLHAASETISENPPCPSLRLTTLSPKRTGSPIPSDTRVTCSNRTASCTASSS